MEKVILLEKAVRELLADINSRPNLPSKSDSFREYYDGLNNQVQQAVYTKKRIGNFDSLYQREISFKKKLLQECLSDSVRKLPLPNEYSSFVMNEFLEYSSAEIFKDYWFIYQGEKFRITSTLEDAATAQSQLLKKFFEDKGWGDNLNTETFDLLRVPEKSKYDVLFFSRIKPDYAKKLYNELLKIQYPQEAKLDRKVFDFQYKMLLDFFEKAKSENYIALTQNWD